MAFGVNETNLPPVPPPPGERNDRFGLPTNWTLLDFDTADREAAVASLVRDVFSVAVRHLGEDRARTLCAGAAARKRGRRPNDGPTAVDEALLAIYDARAPGLTRLQLAALPRRIALERPRIPGRREHGQSAESIQKHLRRALRRRAAARAQDALRRAAEQKRADEYRRSGGSLMDFDLLRD
jgi:hypothetical protein